jgi:hypothetical protein
MRVEEHIKFSLLFDIYGNLLSKKQYEVMDKFLNLDISESELAELDSESRQSVHDAVKKAKKQLMDFEEKCHLLDERLKRNQKLETSKAFLQGENFDAETALRLIDEAIDIR